MQRKALIVGIDRYRDAQIHDLRYAVEDARRVTNFLELAGFDARFLHDASSDEVLEEVERRAAGLRRGDLFLLFFSGHGVELNGRHLLICNNANHRRLPYHFGTLPVDLLKDESGLTGADRVFIFDTCREPLLKQKGVECRMTAGAASSLRDLASAPPGSSAAVGGLTILCSCDEGDSAQESAGLSQGLFSAALIDTWRERLAAEEAVPLDQSLLEAVRARMQAEAARGGLRLSQRPWLQSSGPPVVLVPGRRKAAAAQVEQAKQQPPPPPPPPAEVLWHISVDGHPSAGMRLAALQREIRAGRVAHGTLVWSTESGVWKPAGEVETLATFFAVNEMLGKHSLAPHLPIAEAPEKSSPYALAPREIRRRFADRIGAERFDHFVSTFDPRKPKFWQETEWKTFSQEMEGAVPSNWNEVGEILGIHPDKGKYFVVGILNGKKVRSSEKISDFNEAIGLMQLWWFGGPEHLSPVLSDASGDFDHVKVVECLSERTCLAYRKVTKKGQTEYIEYSAQ